MIVRLTFHQARSVARRVSGFHAEAMVEHRTPRGRTQHDYELPPIAWRQILDELTRTCFGPMGGKLDRGVPKSAYSAISRIADSVRRIENHPALLGRSVEGWIGDQLLLWSNGGLRPNLKWCPYPDADEPEASVRLFEPVHSFVNDMELTSWRPTDPVRSEFYSLNTDAHEAFLGRSAKPDSETELLADQFEFEDLVGRQTFGRSES